MQEEEVRVQGLVDGDEPRVGTSPAVFRREHVNHALLSRLLYLVPLDVRG